MSSVLSGSNWSALSFGITLGCMSMGGTVLTFGNAIDCFTNVLPSYFAFCYIFV